MVDIAMHTAQWHVNLSLIPPHHARSSMTKMKGRNWLLLLTLPA